MTTESTAPALPEAWTAYITPFATTLGKPVAEVTELLKPIVGEPGDQAIALLKDAAMSPDAALKGVLQGTPLAIANKAISQLRETKTVAATPAMAFGASDILPAALTDDSLLSALRTGGVLKVEQSTVVSAMRTALANRLGLYDIPDALVKRMESFADENAEPVPSDFFALREMMTRRNYAEIFEAVPGLKGNFVTDARRNQLFRRINEHLWPAITSFQVQLKAWVDSWQQGAANPAMMMSALAALAGGGSMGMPPGMMQPPETSALRDAADAFNDQINKVFAGTGVQIASALAYDAMQIKSMLENPRLPALIGAANRDQMLRQLGVEVSATYPRLETNLCRYVVSIMKVKDIADGPEAQQYLGALFMLGSQIPWDDLNKGRRGPTASVDDSAQVRRRLQNTRSDG
ncbi:MAG: hypothetical protein KBE09_03045 [Candidatus Pacebacteria bacterium]|nr:hypothetical protein [Candidatus Paceibacterota bacterium]